MARTGTVVRGGTVIPAHVAARAGTVIPTGLAARAHTVIPTGVAARAHTVIPTGLAARAGTVIPARTVIAAGMVPARAIGFAWIVGPFRPAPTACRHPVGSAGRGPLLSHSAPPGN